MTIEYRNAKRVSNYAIECEINHPRFGWIPFGCVKGDASATEFNSTELYEVLDADPNTLPYIPPSEEHLFELASFDIRTKRKQIMAKEVDPIISNHIRWSGLKPERQQEWLDYRKALLDITDQAGFPFDVVWPERPYKTNKGLE